jgi:hypothetical protein
MKTVLEYVSEHAGRCIVNWDVSHVHMLSKRQGAAHVSRTLESLELCFVWKWDVHFWVVVAVLVQMIRIASR